MCSIKALHSIIYYFVTRITISWSSSIFYIFKNLLVYSIMTQSLIARPILEGDYTVTTKKTVSIFDEVDQAKFLYPFSSII